MARTLNPEVSIMNITNQDHDIKDSFTRLLIADEEELIVASRDYDVNEFFIGNDRYLYRTLTAITAGTAFNIGVNVQRGTTVAAALYDLFAQSPESLQELMGSVELTDYAEKNYHTGDYIIWKDGFLYLVTADVTIGTAWAVGTNITLKTNIMDELTSLKEALSKQTLFFSSVACAATTGNFATVSNANISTDHVLVECTFANPSAVTTDVTWTTSNGSLVLNGTCASATTANITLSKKGN